MKLKYVGESFGAVGLTNGVTYIATVGDLYYYSVFDDSGDSYLYFKDNPRPSDGSSNGGKWEIVEDMNERERSLYERFKECQRNYDSKVYNSLVDEVALLREEYAEKYKNEIEAVIEETTNMFDFRWLPIIESRHGNNIAGKCPVCNSDNTDFSFTNVKKEGCSAVIWCNNCKSAHRVDDVTITDEQNVNKPIPEGLKYFQR